VVLNSIVYARLSPKIWIEHAFLPNLSVSALVFLIYLWLMISSKCKNLPAAASCSIGQLVSNPSFSYLFMVDDI
jgi:hypothetical protein